MTFYHGNGKILFTDVGINIEHTLGFFNGLFCGFVHGVTFLPKEFHSAQEGTRGFFPTADIAPLVIKFRQVAVGLDYFCIMVAEKRFGSGAHAHSFLKLLAAAHGGTVEGTDFGAVVSVCILLPQENAAGFDAALTELSAGTMTARREGERFLPGPRE